MDFIIIYCGRNFIMLMSHLAKEKFFNPICYFNVAFLKMRTPLPKTLRQPNKIKDDFKIEED